MFNHEQCKVYFRDKIVDFKDATISIACTGFLYGLGVFTGIRAHYNKSNDSLYLFRLEDHFERFSFGCKLCRYKNFEKNFTFEKFRSLLIELFRINNIREDAYVRATNFTDENIITPKFVDYKDSFCAFLYPLGDYLPSAGMKCQVSSWSRLEDNSIPARAKLNGAYINTAFAKTEALKNGFNEAIFLDRSGHVVEGSAENIFLVMKDTIVTPPVTDNILEGITRKSVIEIAKNEGIPLVERSIDRTELYKADEIFLTGTAARVSPVTQLDHYTIGSGAIGPISEKIQKIYLQAVRGQNERYMHWLTDVTAR